MRLSLTAYHPQTDGLVERVNGVLKSMLRKVTGHDQKNWNKYLPCVLFAYREVPQQVLHLSLSMDDPLVDSPRKSTHEYVSTIQKRLEEMTTIAHGNKQVAI